ncbi:hypothetical protein CDV25_06930 [Helicobacter apodemus]|uniref:Type II secretion system protein n=1 Tax=Helicobacter apodemus TaxID=135569 RepID=A0A099UCA9_9HELI|nr:hypothetical protein CDV25_06930 [Helicobacter apodemus]
MRRGYILFSFVLLIVVGGMIFFLSLKKTALIQSILQESQSQVWLVLHMQSFRNVLKEKLQNQQIAFSKSNFAEFSMRFDRVYHYKAILTRVENTLGSEIYWVDILGTQEGASQKYSMSFQSFLYW